MAERTDMHKEHRKRTKKEFLARPDVFPDHKLLELLLFYADPRRDTNGTAHLLMEAFGSWAGVLDAAPEELMKVPGVGEHAATLLKAVKAVSGRYLSARTSMTDIVNTARDAYDILRPYYFGATGERVFMLCLDGKNKTLGVRCISEGNVNAAEVTTRAVVEAALALNSAQVILAHNHVSGVALPSVEDQATTTNLSRVLRAVGVSLRDHIIIVDDDMVSMRESGFDGF